MPGFNIPLNAKCVDTDAFKESGTYVGPHNTVETARVHRYRLEILEPLQSVVLFCEKCTRPTPEIDEIVIHNGQDEIYRPGKQRWSPIEFTFYEKLRGGDPLTGIGDQTDETAELIYKWWGETMIDLTRSAHNPVKDYYKQAQLQMLDGVGNPVWTYFIYDCWPQKVSPTDLSYSDSEIATITVTLRFNKAQERRDK